MYGLIIYIYKKVNILITINTLYTAIYVKQVQILILCIFFIDTGYNYMLFIHFFLLNKSII